MSTFRRRTFASSIRENTWIHAWWQLRTVSRTSSTTLRSTKDTIQRLGIVFICAMVTIPLLLVTFYSWGLRFAGFWRGLGKLCVVVIADWDMERTELISKGSNCIGSICGIHVRTSYAYTWKTVRRAWWVSGHTLNTWRYFLPWSAADGAGGGPGVVVVGAGRACPLSRCVFVGEGHGGTGRVTGITMSFIQFVDISLVVAVVDRTVDIFWFNQSGWLVSTTHGTFWAAWPVTVGAIFAHPLLSPSILLTNLLVCLHLLHFWIWLSFNGRQCWILRIFWLSLCYAFSFISIKVDNLFF